MNRALVSLEIKALDDDARTIEGWATTPDVDRIGDVVMPKGAKYSLPMPFLLDHDHEKVVGEVDHVEVSDKGIKFRAHIKKVAEPGAVRELLDSAWALVKNGLRRSVSIGFRPLEFEPLPSGGLKFTAWEWYELSAVGIPALPQARITGTKSYSVEDRFVAEDADEPAPEIQSPPEPAATGKRLLVVRLDDPAGVSAPFVINQIKVIPR